MHLYSIIGFIVGPEGYNQVLFDFLTVTRSPFLMSVFTDRISVLSHPFAICSTLELSVRVRKLIIMPGSFRLACFILIPVKALAVVLRDSLDHFIRLVLPKQHVSHKVRGGCVGLLGDPRAAHQTQLAGFESLDLLHGNEFVEIERVIHKLQEKTLFEG